MQSFEYSELSVSIDTAYHLKAEENALWDAVTANLAIAADYVTAFKAVYPTGLQVRRVTDGIARFEGSLLTPNSCCDGSLRWDDKALTANETAG